MRRLGVLISRWKSGMVKWIELVNCGKDALVVILSLRHVSHFLPSGSNVRKLVAHTLALFLSNRIDVRQVGQI